MPDPIMIYKGERPDPFAQKAQPDFESDKPAERCANCGAKIDHNAGIDLCSRCLRSR
jgi:predicted amidophosphoribosyltransferase